MSQVWLKSRADEIIADRGQLAVQTELFANSERRAANSGMANSSVHRSPFTVHSSWARLTDPLERLAGFASDNAQPVALRHEAQTVLTLFKKRREDLDARESVREPEVTTLGMLMIVPRKLC